jgi:hypothetical protein
MTCFSLGISIKHHDDSPFQILAYSPLMTTFLSHSTIYAVETASLNNPRISQSQVTVLITLMMGHEVQPEVLVLDLCSFHIHRLH